MELGEPQICIWLGRSVANLGIPDLWLVSESGGQSCGTEPLTCGVPDNSGELASEFNSIIGYPAGVGELLLGGAPSGGGIYFPSF